MLVHFSLLLGIHFEMQAPCYLVGLASQTKHIRLTEYFHYFQAMCYRILESLGVLVLLANLAVLAIQFFSMLFLNDPVILNYH